MIRRHPRVLILKMMKKSYTWDELKAQEKKKYSKFCIGWCIEKFACFSGGL